MNSRSKGTPNDREKVHFSWPLLWTEITCSVRGCIDDNGEAKRIEQPAQSSPRFVLLSRAICHPLSDRAPAYHDSPANRYLWFSLD